ncbi:Glia maturation factor gamma [Acropora cervicornis]|uniref:Glia maturation factor gamma n=1 Tax=Acropora cervicornis TaxID=6130 RepID=A0AAD9QWH9_ACRCE|nr:Glia maturation factor gamma [Acropora cervicornis]
MIVLDEEHENISIEELREELPSQQPRYPCLNKLGLKMSINGCKPELQMMYSGSKKALEKDIGATKIFELRSVDELTEEWLVEKLKFFR